MLPWARSTPPARARHRLRRPRFRHRLCHLVHRAARAQPRRARRRCSSAFRCSRRRRRRPARRGADAAPGACVGRNLGGIALVPSPENRAHRADLAAPRLGGMKSKEWRPTAFVETAPGGVHRTGSRCLAPRSGPLVARIPPPPDDARHGRPGADRGPDFEGVRAAAEARCRRRGRERVPFQPRGGRRRPSGAAREEPAVRRRAYAGGRSERAPGLVAWRPSSPSSSGSVRSPGSSSPTGFADPDGPTAGAPTAPVARASAELEHERLVVRGPG